MPRIPGFALAMIVLVAVVVLYGFMSIHIVQPGSVGVVVQLGQVQQYTLPPGFYIRPWIFQSVVAFETRVRQHAFKEVDASSSEYQSVKLTGSLNFSVEPARASELYSRLGSDFADRVIDAAFTDIIKEIVPQYGVTEILGKRDVIRTRTKELLAGNLSRYGITVDDVYLTNIAFSPEYTAAIEAKQVAAQQVEQQRQILEQKRVQADQAEADALGRARAVIAEADGQATANRKLAESISPVLIDYQRVQKWDGRLPLYQGDANVMLPLPSSASSPTQAPATGPAPAPTRPAAPGPSPVPAR